MNEYKKCYDTSFGPVKTAECGSLFELSQSNDSGLADRYANEALLIAGADINVFKLLGIYQQGKMTDLAEHGNAISSGDQPTYEAANVFDENCGEWRSMQRGSNVLDKAFIGYNFGDVKLRNGRNQYGIVSYVQQHITTIKIAQSDVAKNRATKARVEYSSDGESWRGAGIITLPDNGNLNTVHLKQSTQAKYWRLRPTTFNGGNNDYWAVKTIQLIDLSATMISNVQDEWGFLENRDREYAKNSTRLKAYYEMIDVQSLLSRFGMDSTDEFTLKFHFLSMVASLGRPIVIGDVLEIPSQVQYGPDMQPIKKYVEVTATSWATDGFTAGWRPTILKVVAAPMLAKQETMDIVGDFVAKKDATGLFNVDLNNTTYSPLADILNQRVEAASREIVQESGEDDTHVPMLAEQDIEVAKEIGADITKLVRSETNLSYVRDAMPPGGAPYTEGDSYPTSPKDGDYHRLTYKATDPTISPRLYRFNLKKNRWVYLETDERSYMTLNNTKQAIFLNSNKKVNINEVK